MDFHRCAHPGAHKSRSPPSTARSSLYEASACSDGRSTCQGIRERGHVESGSVRVDAYARRRRSDRSADPCPGADDGVPCWSGGRPAQLSLPCMASAEQCGTARNPAAGRGRRPVPGASATAPARTLGWNFRPVPSCRSFLLGVAAETELSLGRATARCRRGAPLPVLRVHADGN